MKQPLIILAPMRSFSTVVNAMLGQHPQMRAILETHLFTRDTMAEWWFAYRKNNQIMGQGLFRTVAELVMGTQNEMTIRMAKLWILKRLNWPTTEVFRFLANLVAPSVLIDKSPLIVSDIEHLQRAYKAFPKAKFLHLTRHPVGFGKSYLKFFDNAGSPVEVDPQNVWFRQHSRIISFLMGVPRDQQTRVRGEDLLANTDHHLKEIANWIGVRATADAIDPMKHPERSCFSRFGPMNAMNGGGDPLFFRDPRLHPLKGKPANLEVPVPWLPTERRFLPHVRELAQQLGYA